MSFWSERTKSERFLISIAGIAIVVGIPLMLTPPAGSNKKLLPAAEARQQYRKTVNEKSSLDKETDEYAPKIKELASDELPDKIMPVMVKAIQACATNAGIHVREIKPLRPKQIGTVTRIPLSVRFSSEFQKTTKFIYDLEDPKGKLVVEKYSVSSSDAKAGLVDIEIQVTMFTTANVAANSGDVASIQ